MEDELSWEEIVVAESSIENENPSFTKNVVIGNRDVLSPDFTMNFSEVEFIDLGNTITSDFGYTGYSPLNTSGTFWKAVFTVTNQKTESVPFTLESLWLIDDKGREYAAVEIFHCENPLNTYSRNSVRSFSRFLLKPAIPCRFAALFEVSDLTDMASLELQYSNKSSFFD